MVSQVLSVLDCVNPGTVNNANDADATLMNIIRKAKALVLQPTPKPLQVIQQPSDDEVLIGLSPEDYPHGLPAVLVNAVYLFGQCRVLVRISAST